LSIVLLTSCQGDSSADEPAAASRVQGVPVSADTSGLAQTTTIKGTKVQLGRRFQNAVAAHRNTDGSITIECHDNPQDVEAFMQRTAPTAKSEVR